MGDLNNEVDESALEAKGNGKLRFGLVICIGLVLILGFSASLFFMLTRNLQNRLDILQSQHASLEMTYQNYVANHLFTNEEYDMAKFDFYYVYPIEQNYGVNDLDYELSSGVWVDPYQAGMFDCSEMSAYMEWELENLGWNTVILIGDAPFGSGYHAWLLVEASEGGYIPVEATTLEIVWWSNPYFDNYFEYDYAFDTIQEALAYNESEFDWWES